MFGNLVLGREAEYVDAGELVGESVRAGNAASICERTEAPYGDPDHVLGNEAAGIKESLMKQVDE